MIQEVNWITAPDGTKYGYVYHYPKTRQKYEAAIATVSCYDDDFWDPFKKYTRGYLQRLQKKKMDSMRFAGGALALSSPRMPYHRDFVLDNIAIAVEHHDVERLKLYTHHDCVYADGIDRFNGDGKVEFAFHCRELTLAHQIVQERFAELEIRLHFMNCTGIIRIEPNPALLLRP